MMVFPKLYDERLKRNRWYHMLKSKHFVQLDLAQRVFDVPSLPGDHTDQVVLLFRMFPDTSYKLEMSGFEESTM